MGEVKITIDNFKQEVLDCDIPVLVDFWASWCGPCMMLAPAIEECAKEWEGKVKVGKINVDEESELAISYGVMSIPTLMVFKDGKIVNQSVGYCSKAEVEALLK